jgi:hypothetical protein
MQFLWQFPSLDALHAALPPTMPVSSGVSAMGAVPASLPQTLPTNAGSADWAYSFTQFNTTSPSGTQILRALRIDFILDVSSYFLASMIGNSSVRNFNLLYDKESCILMYFCMLFSSPELFIKGWGSSLNDIFCALSGSFNFSPDQTTSSFQVPTFPG